MSACFVLEPTVPSLVASGRRPIGVKRVGPNTARIQDRRNGPMLPRLQIGGLPSPQGGAVPPGSPVRPQGGAVPPGSPVHPQGGAVIPGSPVRPQGGAVPPGSPVSLGSPNVNTGGGSPTRM